MENERIKISVHQAPEKDFQLIKFDIANSILDYSFLSQIELPEGIDYSKGIIISGKGPVWLYAHLTHLCHVAAWVATADPRLGAVVVQNHIPNGRAVGSIISQEDLSNLIDSQPKTEKPKKQDVKQHKVIALVGPPHSGKSVFLNALRMRLQNEYPEIFNNDFFIIRACPDGEGDWFGDIPENQGKQWRYSTHFTNEFVEKSVEGIRNAKATKKILMVDCGGKIDKINQRILNECSDAIIISSKSEETPEWRGALKASENKIIAEINSVLDNILEINSDLPLKITMGEFDRNNVKSITMRLPKELIDRILNIDLV